VNATLFAIAGAKINDDTGARLHHLPPMPVSTSLQLTLAPCFGAGSRALGASPSGSFRFLPAQLTCALEALLALVLAQDARFIDTRFESPKKLIERLALASFNVHNS